MAYRSGDIDRLRSNLDQVDQAYRTDEGPSVRKSICRHLCTIALKERNANMLWTVLQENISYFDRDFEWGVDDLKHDGSAPDILKILDESGYVSPFPPGQRWFEQHFFELMR